MSKSTLIIMLLALSISACSPQPLDSSPESHQAQWERQAYTHYRFTVVVGCFCPYANAEVTYEVHDGVATLDSIHMPDDSQVEDVERVTDLYKAYNTIEKIFAYVERAKQEADALDVEYNPAYGYPTSVSIDWVQNALDDEMYLEISYFNPLP